MENVAFVTIQLADFLIAARVQIFEAYRALVSQSQIILNYISAHEVQPTDWNLSNLLRPVHVYVPLMAEMTEQNYDRHRTDEGQDADFDE